MKSGYLALFATLMTILPAQAHDAKGAHGGRIGDAGAYHAELVVKERVIEIFLTSEDDKPVNPKDFKGVAIFNLGGKAERITLTPSDRNALSGKAATALPARPKGAVQVTAPDGKTVTARFD